MPPEQLVHRADAEGQGLTVLALDLELEPAADWFGVQPTLAEIADVLFERLDEGSAS